MIVIHNEEAMKSHLKSIKKPFTKFMPVEVNGWTYNARFIQNVWKKLNKNGVYVINIEVENGTIILTYKTASSKGTYTIYPIIYTGSIVGRGDFINFF